MTAQRRLAAEAAGELLVVGLAGPLPTAMETEALAELGPAGIILFARNVESAMQVRHLVARIAGLTERPLILIDQEGGRVDRLRRLRGRSPAPRDLAREGRRAVREFARETASALRDLGVNFNCAPVLDLDLGHEANGIGDRSLGAEPEEVAELAAEIVDAHAGEGVATSLKHFPGLGRTGADTHEVRPTVRASRDEILASDVVPFRLLRDRAPAVMVSHAAFPGLTGDDIPASCSEAVVSGLLRRDLGFEGLCVTDDLEMGAVREWSPAGRAVAAVAAGQDLLLYCSDLAQARQARDGIREAVLDGRLEPERVLQAAARVRQLRREIG